MKTYSKTYEGGEVLQRIELGAFCFACVLGGEEHDARARAMPEVDWRAIVREEEAEIAAMGSLSSAKWRQVAVIAAVVLAVHVAFKLLG